MAKLIETQNEQFGFFGTSKSNYGLSDKATAELFDFTAKRIAVKGNVSHGLAREYLDATYGRHMSDALSFHGAKSRAPLSAVKKSVTKYLNERDGDVRFLRKELAKLKEETELGISSGSKIADILSGQNPVVTKMVALISKRVLEEIISEDLANELAHELTQRPEWKNRPDLHDEFMEACGTVEEKVRKALGVKRGKSKA